MDQRKAEKRLIMTFTSLLIGKNTLHYAKVERKITSFSNFSIFLPLTDLFSFPCHLHLFSFPTISKPSLINIAESFLSSKILIGFHRAWSQTLRPPGGMLPSALFWSILIDAIIDCSGSKKGQGRGERKGQVRRWISMGRCRGSLSGLNRMVMSNLY